MKDNPIKIGDKRQVIAYAWFPKVVENKFIWFKRYISVQEFKTDFFYYNEMVQTGIPYEVYNNPIKILTWVEIERKAIHF